MSIARPLASTPSARHAFAAVGGGCFWCAEAVFIEIDGVVDVGSGDSGGTNANRGDDAVCSGATCMPSSCGSRSIRP